MCCVTEYAPATREHSSDNPQFAQCNNIRRIVNTIVPIWLKSIVVLYVSFDIIKAMFLKAYSFLRAKLKKNCLLLRSENVCMQHIESYFHTKLRKFPLSTSWRTAGGSLSLIIRTYFTVISSIWWTKHIIRAIIFQNESFLKFVKTSLKTDTYPY